MVVTIKCCWVFLFCEYHVICVLPIASLMTCVYLLIMFDAACFDPSKLTCFVVIMCVSQLQQTMSDAPFVLSPLWVTKVYCDMKTAWSLCWCNNPFMLVDISSMYRSEVNDISSIDLPTCFTLIEPTLKPSATQPVVASCISEQQIQYKLPLVILDNWNCVSVLEHIHPNILCDNCEASANVPSYILPHCT